MKTLVISTILASILISSSSVENEEDASGLYPSHLSSSPSMAKMASVSNYLMNKFKEGDETKTCKSFLAGFRLVTKDLDIFPNAKTCLDKMIAPGEACMQAVGCLSKALVKWHEGGVDEIQAECCSGWDLIDCIFESNKDKCEENEYDELKKIWEDNNKDMNSNIDCTFYPYGSQMCNKSS